MIIVVLSINEYRVLNMIPRGIEQTITTSDISKVTGVKKRIVRDIISSLINVHGVPIVGNRNGGNAGMFIATNESERSIGITSFRSQVNTMNIRIKAIEQADLMKWEKELQPEIKRLDAVTGVEHDTAS